MSQLDLNIQTTDKSLFFSEDCNKENLNFSFKNLIKDIRNVLPELKIKISKKNIIQLEYERNEDYLKIEVVGNAAKVFIMNDGLIYTKSISANFKDINKTLKEFGFCYNEL